MTNQNLLIELEYEISQATKENNDPRLAEALLAYFRYIRKLPNLTFLELKSLFISFNGRGQGRGESLKYPLSEADIRAFERIGELVGISTNSIEGIIRTHARATSELIKAQKERALSRQAADIISRLDKENSSLQGRVVQLYFEKGLEIKELAEIVRKLLEYRLPEQQETILGEYLQGDAERSSSSILDISIASTLTQIINMLQDLELDELDDSELLSLMSIAKKAAPIIERTREECFKEVTKRFGS